MNSLESLGIAVRQNGRAEQRTACPQCGKGPRDDAMGINIEDGRFNCFRCGYKGRAGSESTTPRPVIRLNDPAVAERKRERLRRTWEEAVPLDHPSAAAVRRYLAARGLPEVLDKPPDVLRAHPALRYWNGRDNFGAYPALLALLTDEQGMPVTIHATYLRHDGTTKAPVQSPRKILGVPVPGATRGGAIRLHHARNGVLGVAEGIESALSLHLLQQVPVWAAFCADNLERIRLPRNLKKLYIGVDVDESGKGEQVATALATRISAWRHAPKVFLVRPDGPAPRDLNDEVRRRRAG